MEWIKFECETITPMFLAGADGVTPELRAASIKGALRFWWRAMHGDFPLEELHRKEAEIFGGTGEGQGRSKVIVRVVEYGNIKTTKIQLLPHKAGGSALSINPSQKFNLLIGINTDNYRNLMLTLVKIIATLGGIGKRSRRGFGSFKIAKIDDLDYQGKITIETICSLLNIVNNANTYKVESGKIVLNKVAHNTANYPYIKEIAIGNTHSDYHSLLKKIGEASHYNNSKCTGNAVGGRFSSPEYVSILKTSENEYRPIIISLNMEYKREWCGSNDTRVNFKGDIING